MVDASRFKMFQQHGRNGAPTEMVLRLVKAAADQEDVAIADRGEEPRVVELQHVPIPAENQPHFSHDYARIQ